MNSIASTTAARIELLKEAYENAKKKNGLIDFTKEVRTEKNDMSGKYNVPLDRIQQLFSNSICWVQTNRGGHVSYEHQVTKITIGASNHGDTVDTGAVVDILNAVQEHLNVLANNIFCFKDKDWDNTPDYPAAEKRWTDMAISQSSPKADGEKKTKR